MEVRTYRARSIQEALQQVRGELGPQASILHTREVRPGVWGWLRGGRQIEVTASAVVHVPSRFEEPQRSDQQHVDDRHLDNRQHVDNRQLDEQRREPQLAAPARPVDVAPLIPRADEDDFRGRLRRELSDPNAGHSVFEELCQSVTGDRAAAAPLPEALFEVFTALLDAEMPQDLARELLDELRHETPGHELENGPRLMQRLREIVERQLRVTGPLQVTPDARRIVALVGPTGVGKTTTIAKLAANYHLRQQRRVGLITVDTYRIAAVEQLRTYADIIDLPMEVVSTPREMRQAVERLADLELVLVDTAGRSPRDELQIQELRAMLAEAQADEVHLVLSSVASSRSLQQAASRFARVGTTALLLTKLDEAQGLGNLLSLVRDCGLPISYLTHGQNVPEDIAPADTSALASAMLNSETD